MAGKLLLLLLTALPLMGSPGPATLSLAALGAAYGVPASLRYLVGIIAGTTTVLLIVASGVGGLFLAAPSLVPAIVAIAALYILYLAWCIATAPLPGKASPGDKPPSLVGGYLLAVANPKAYAAIGAVYSGVAVVEGDLAVDAALKIFALTAVIVGVNTVWLLLGSAMSSLLASPRIGRAINVGFAVLLVASVAAALLL